MIQILEPIVIFLWLVAVLQMIIHHLAPQFSIMKFVKNIKKDTPTNTPLSPPFEPLLHPSQERDRSLFDERKTAYRVMTMNSAGKRTIQTLYGNTETNDSNMHQIKRKIDINDSKCRVCLVNYCSYMNFPCRHITLCTVCFLDLKKSFKKQDCLRCNQRVEEQIYR